MSKIKDTFFGGAEKRSGEIQQRAAETSVQQQAAELEESKRRFELSREDLAPFREAGVGALEQQQAFLGLSGVGAQQQAFDQFTESPGQAFLRERGEKALLRNASAIGGLGGGNVRSALVQQGVGFAQQDFQNQLNQLAGLSGTGQQATTATAQLGSQLSAQAGQSLAQQAQTRQLGAAARGTGLVGQASGAREGVGQIAQIAGGFSDLRLKENIQKLGELSSGLGWYSWDWTEEGKALAGAQETMGVIAQEAAEIFPDAIGEQGGFMTVNYKEIH